MEAGSGLREGCDKGDVRPRAQQLPTPGYALRKLWITECPSGPDRPSSDLQHSKHTEVCRSLPIILERHVDQP
jgi:hypothetical protein